MESAVAFLLPPLALLIGLAVWAAVIYAAILVSQRLIGQLFKFDMALIRWLRSTSVAQRQVGTPGAGSQVLADKQDPLVAALAKVLKPISNRTAKFVQTNVIYAATVNNEPTYTVDTVSQTYHLPQDLALDSIASCLKEMIHTFGYSNSEVRWQSIKKTAEDLTCELSFAENVEPLLRQTYKRAYHGEPLVYCDEIVQERSMQLRVVCQRLGATSTKVKFVWDITSPLDRTTTSEIISTTITKVNKALQDDTLQQSINCRMNAQFANASLRRTMKPQEESKWPTPQDYNEAVQNPSLNFKNPDICNGKLELSTLGLPRPITGAFASVYRMYQADGRSIAVRCFLRPTTDHEDRYRTVGAYVSTDALEATIRFEFIDAGIRVGERWYPIVRMEWLEGISLSAFIKEHLNDPERLLRMAATFAEMIDTLQHAGVAHGDLQHGNILVIAGDRLRLVDYDGMYVPALKGQMGYELGHRNYQHPSRTPSDFNERTDYFSAWVIYTALICVSEDRSLWEQFDGGDECLLFRQRDFVEPIQSQLFQTLLNHQSQKIREAASFLMCICQSTLDDVPPFEQHAHKLIINPAASETIVVAAAPHVKT